MKNEEVMKGVCLHSKETVDIKVKIIRISSDPQDLQQVRVLKFSWVTLILQLLGEILKTSWSKPVKFYALIFSWKMERVEELGK